MLKQYQQHDNVSKEKQLKQMNNLIDRQVKDGQIDGQIRLKTFIRTLYIESIRNCMSTSRSYSPNFSDFRYQLTRYQLTDLNIAVV